MKQDWTEFKEEYSDRVKKYCLAEADVEIRNDPGQGYFFDCDIKDCTYILAGLFPEEYVYEAIKDYDFERIDKEGLWHLSILLKYHPGDYEDGESGYMEILLVDEEFQMTFEEKEQHEKEVQEMKNNFPF
jgi:hypothetical protein